MEPNVNMVPFMSKNKIKFTHNRLLDIQPTDKRAYYYDSDQKELRLSVTPSGTKTFQFRMWSPTHRKPLLRTLGRLGQLSIKDARQLALQLAIDVTNGLDIESDRRAAREEMTFAEVFDAFIENHAKQFRSTWPEDTRTFKNHMAYQFGKHRIDWLTTERVRSWHMNLGKNSGKIAANRALGLLSSVFVHILPERKNPTKGIKKFPEKSRDRFLNPSELALFFKSLMTESNQDMIDLFLLLLLTGARKSNVMAMRWNHLDLNEDTWTVPSSESKSGEKMTLPLVPQAKEILIKRRRQASSVFVFPSLKSKTGHIVEPKSAWNRIISRAGLKDVRIHDLRRTLGSYMAAGNTSQLIISKALGHSDPSATTVYARLNLDPVRQAMLEATNTILNNKTFKSNE